MIERVCVVGGGVIGSLFAGHLAQVCEVSVLARRQEHADALEREGLRISGKTDLQARVCASTDAAALGDPDLAIVATKANGLRSALGSMAGAFPGATVMTVLNGLGAGTSPGSTATGRSSPP
jgi:2-dehydropantoate 2-reductase